MAKINIVNAFNWVCNVIDLNKLTPAEQVSLWHLMKLLNRNFWKPVKISEHMFAQTSRQDARTAKKALTSLIEKEIIYKQGDEYFVGIEPFEKIKHKFTDTRKQNSKSEGNPDDNKTKPEQEPSDSERKKLSDFISDDFDSF